MKGRLAILDACVLVPSLLCDLLLSLAEEGLFEPRWSAQILDEVMRGQIKVGFPEGYAQRWRLAVERAFPESEVLDYENHLEDCRNHPKDRHVLAAAIESFSPAIVTFNVRDFPTHALEPWSILVVHPSDFLLALYSEDSDLVVRTLVSMASRRSTELAKMMAQLRKVVPAFTGRVANDLGLSLR